MYNLNITKGETLTLKNGLKVEVIKADNINGIFEVKNTFDNEIFTVNYNQFDL